MLKRESEKAKSGEAQASAQGEPGHCGLESRSDREMKINNSEMPRCSEDDDHKPDSHSPSLRSWKPVMSLTSDDILESGSLRLTKFQPPGYI